jgi:hypothetical protein
MLRKEIHKAKALKIKFLNAKSNYHTINFKDVDNHLD